MDWYWDVTLATFVAIALLESFYPRRSATHTTLHRWAVNLALLATTTVVGVLSRVSPLVVASFVAASPYGLLNRSFIPDSVRFVIGLAALDAIRYGQHWTMHHVGVLWRLHQVHHSDDQLDLTTGLRFHPLEAVVSHVSYLAIIGLLAPPLAAVVAIELATVVQNFVAHANVRLPARAEALLRLIFVTPEVHTVHHSVRRDEQNTNFGLLFLFWDRLFHTYRPSSPDMAANMRFGLSRLEPSDLTLGRLLAMPFVTMRSRRVPAARTSDGSNVALTP
jgi:sterol desaturase/sphingolipid hydroxylase (fatty acid hydroxylase superfamily)